MMQHKRLTRRAATAGILGTAVASLVRPSPAFAAVQRPFKYAFANSDLGSADPINIRASNDDVICRQVFMSLVSPPYGTGDNALAHCQPELAERWESSPDRKQWTFFLKRGVMFHRGYGEVTADDVKFSFDRVRSLTTGSLYAEGFADLEKVEVLDSHTVRFHLTYSNPIFHATHLFPREGGFVVCRKAVEEMGATAFSRNPVGSGAYEFAGYQPGRQVTLKANPNFHRGKPKLDELHFLYMPETAARTIAFRKGDLDFIDGARAPGWTPDLKRAMPAAQVRVLFPGSTQIMHLDTSRKPFSDLRVRQAVAYGLNRSVWKEAYGELSGPLYGMNAPGAFGALSEKDVPAELRYAYDPERAKALLKEAGYPQGLEVAVYISKREDYTTNMLLIQEQLKKIGITINLTQVDHATYHSDNRKDKNQMVVMSGPNTETVGRWDATYFAANADVRPDGKGGNNFSHYGVKSPGVDKALEEARAEGDADKQAAMFRAIEIQLLRDLPAVPLQCLGWVWVKQPFVKIPFELVSGSLNFPMENIELEK
jgi:peptide/nickel transport system substrate-binding protein